MGRSEKTTFTNSLDHIDPARLIKDGKKDDVADFFLTLGAFFNDLKSLFLYLLLLDEEFKNTPEGISAEKGEYGGAKSHLERLIIGTVHEFFVFLGKESHVLKTGEFSLICNAMNKNKQAQWSLLVEIAEGRDVNSKNTSFGKALQFIRNNASFHLSPKEMRRAFIERFYKDKKDDNNKIAYYSIGQNMQNTRFYYCDATVQRMIKSEAERCISYQDYANGIKNVLNYINTTLSALLKEYIRQRPY